MTRVHGVKATSFGQKLARFMMRTFQAIAGLAATATIWCLSAVLAHEVRRLTRRDRGLRAGVNKVFARRTKKGVKGKWDM